MFEVIIKNILGIQTHGQLFPTRFLAEEWISKGTLEKYWGKSEGWYLESELSQAEIATALNILPIDETHNQRRILIPAQFTAEVIDRTEEHNKRLYIEKKDKDASFGAALVRELQYINHHRLISRELSLEDALNAKTKLSTIQGHLIDGDPELAKIYIQNYVVDNIITQEIKDLFLNKINIYLGVL